MIPTKRMMYIELFCYSFVSHMFSCMLNPKYRGPNFKWSDFVEQMYNSTPIHFATSKYWQKDLTKEELELLQSVAKRIAQNLVKDAGLVEETA